MGAFLNLSNFIDEDDDKILEYLRNVSVEDFINDVEETCLIHFESGQEDY